jgi:ribosomal protein S13
MSEFITHDITAEDLVKRALMNLRGKRKLRWVAVTDAFAVGSTAAYEICRHFGFDPDEELKR